MSRLSRSLLLVGMLLSVFGWLLSFAAAPRYEPIFVAVFACEIVAITCLTYVKGLGGTWRIVRLFFCLMASFALIDVLLRAFFSVRLLSVFTLLQ